MEPTTLTHSQLTTPENRRATRMRKVRPVAFVSRSTEAEPALRTVTANVSRGGMLLVTRQDQFPPAGAAVLLMPFEVSAASTPDSDAAIQARVVYTRYSPRAKLRFAGLKFEHDLPETAARMLGLNGRPDAVTDAITTLEELEAMSAPPPRAMNEPLSEVETEYIVRAAEGRPVEQPIYAGPELRLHAAMDAARMEFIRAAAGFLGSWGETRIRETLSARHALARAKGVDGLHTMKREWTGLHGNFEALAEAEFERSGAWPRELRGELAEANPFYVVEHDQPRPAIVAGLRSLAGQIGRILIRHGFEDVGSGSDWALIPTDRNAVTFGGAMPPLSDGMRDALLRAAELHGEMRRAREQANTAHEHEARAEAIRLWDRA